MSETRRAEAWNNLQARIETLSQTLFNVRDVNLANGADITDAPVGVRMALADLTHELSMWAGKLSEAVPETRQPVNPELFSRTAPKWNRVDYPGEGMHYAPGETCLWCGMTREQITAEHNKREAGSE